MKKTLHRIIQRVQTRQHGSEAGQSLIEYALILFLVAIAFGIALAATGPAISNVFSNTVYNLLGNEPDENRVVQRPGDFWLTVTWVEENPLTERALPTRELPPPSFTPTDGPSPTPTPVTPTRTPLPSFTPAPTATPGDQAWIAPFHDSADDPEWYRVAGPAFLGYDDWTGEYYPNPDLSGSAAFTGDNHQIYGEEARYVLDFPNSSYTNWNGGSSGPQANWPAGSPYDNFSVRFTRDIFIDGAMTGGQPLQLQFSVQSDDGVRVWLLSPGQSALDCFSVGNGGDGTFSGGPRLGTDRFYGDNSAYPNGCLLVDDWQDQGMGGGGSVVRSIPPGSYTLQVDHYEKGGGSGLQVKISMAANPDNTTISGNPIANPPLYTDAGGGANCNWGQQSGNNANSIDHMWEEHLGGNIPTQSLCYLELRGYVTIPDTGADAIAHPQMTFWDVWELQDAGEIAGWLEVAEYIPLGGPDIAPNRAAMQWYRVPLRSGGTSNYNWTRSVVDLKNFQGFDQNGNPVTEDFSGKNVAFRFAMAQGSDAGTRRWYIDDIRIVDRAVTDFSDQIIGLDQEYTFNQNDDDKFFITTGGWGLTANNTVRDDDLVGNPSSCCSWELNPGGNFYNFSESRWNPDPRSNYIPADYRIHHIQLMPVISRTLALQDMEGDEGDPLLSFWHGYDFDDDYIGMEVQYRALVGGTPANPTWSDWQPIPGSDPGNPVGRLVDGSQQNNNNTEDQQTLRPVDIPLTYIRDAGGNPYEYFQIRFALLVHARAGLGDEGWWIDSIKLHREGKNLYLDFPFEDNAELGMDNWLATGSWFRTNEKSRDGDHSFTDSPGTNYQENTGGSTSGNHLRTLWPVDFNNDTPDNLALLDRNPAGGNSGGFASAPVITFWHTRALSNDDNFHLEWRRVNEDDTQWKGLWSYYYRMETRANRSDSSFVDSIDWEYVEVDLAPLLDEILRPGDPGYGTDLEQDDIMFRFRLYSSSWGTDDGVYIDEFQIREYSERSYLLWSESETPEIDGVTYPTGDGAEWSSDVEEPDWFERWRLGGGWERIDWGQRNGLHSFHESPDGQAIEPYWMDDDYTATRSDTYNILEITEIIDMRATDGATQPTLYFWSRYYTGDDDNVRIQVSYELTPDDWASRGSLDEYMRRDRCQNKGIVQCYEQSYGWSEWTNTSFYVGQWQDVFTWQRYQVDLTNYAADLDADTPGRRIRIRFLFDALDNNDDRKRDGWYVDMVSIEPRAENIVAEIATGPFVDVASNTQNWITEGNWGLSPEVNRTGPGSAVSLGVWQETWFDCRTCSNLAGGNYPNGVSTLLADPDAYSDVDYPRVSRIVFDIAYDPGRGSPRDNVGFFSNGKPDDNLAGQWILETQPVGPLSGIQPGTYSFIATSDDGIRLKYEEIDALGNVIDTLGPPEWNVINNWTYHGRTTDMGTLTLEEGKRYRLTLQFFEGGGNMVSILAVGGNQFSFTDSPKQGAGASFDDQPPIPYGNSSLMLDGVLDMTNVTGPILQYYTLYELGCGSDARVEVSNDGGFGWSRDGLGDDMEIAPGVFDTDFDGGSYSGNEIPFEDDWVLKRHNLSQYEEQQIMIRFRLDRLDEHEMSSNNGCRQDTGSNPWYIGWWIADIQVAKSS